MSIARKIPLFSCCRIRNVFASPGAKKNVVERKEETTQTHPGPKPDSVM